jgi:hypothetical protein
MYGSLIGWDESASQSLDINDDEVTLSDINMNMLHKLTSSNGSNYPSDKLSDAIVYGPRFCELFEEFNMTLPTRIDPSRHLMSLCTEYLIPFSQWARGSIARTSWISEKLRDHEYLRSEVRNGMIMVIIYTFASIKATLIEGADMFTTLQDHDTGDVVLHEHI